MNAPRYAIYYAPPIDSAWWRFGAGWLGWDESRSVALPQPAVPGIPAEVFHQLTSEPRRYGFHATLKAPFRLRPGVSEAELLRHLAHLARTQRREPLGPLLPVRMDGFVALVPAQPRAGIGALAAQCVVQLDPLRAPLTPDELARRRPELLDLQARELLQAWGYPHVLARFRFHLTLTGPVDAALANRLLPLVADRLARLQADATLQLDRLCLFREEHPGAPFQRIAEEVLAP